MILSIFCTLMTLILAINVKSGKIESILDDAVYPEESYPIEENADIIIMPPTNLNEKLIDFKKMWEMVELVVSDFDKMRQFSRHKKTWEVYMVYLHNALVAVKATNIDLINILTIIIHRHNILSEPNFKPNITPSGNFRRGLTGIPSRGKVWSSLDRIAGKGDSHYYSRNNCELDSPTEESILAEVRLYKLFFSKIGNQSTDSIAHILLNYGFNDPTSLKDHSSYTVHKEDIKFLLDMHQLDKDYLAKLNECYCIYAILRKEFHDLHSDPPATP